MNRFENWFCASSIWRSMTRKHLLPWLLSGTELGEHVLEIGAGPGAATEELRKRAGRVTSIEYSHAFARSLAQRSQTTNGAVLQGDASALPFPEKTFSAAIAVLVLHHLKSQELQERAFAEIFRVLRPGGVFLAVEIQDGWLQRIGTYPKHVCASGAFIRAPSGLHRLDFRACPSLLCAARTVCERCVRKISPTLCA